MGPQPLMRLPNTSWGIVNCATSCGLATGCDPSITESLGKHLQVRYRIVSFGEPRIHGELGTELNPQSPVIVGLAGSAVHDAGSDRRLRKAEISEEFISDRSVHAIHGNGCG